MKQFENHKLKGRILLNGETLEAFLLKEKAKQVCPSAPPQLFNIVLKKLANTIR